MRNRGCDPFGMADHEVFRGDEMSSELIEDVDDDHGTCVLLTMNVYNHAFLNVCEDNENSSNDLERGVGSFHLAPDTGGLALAEKIEAGLREWRRHVTED